MHQDDDGFESLNGNVSSDNDKTTARTAVQKLKQKRDALLKNNEERILWLQESTNPQVVQPIFSGLSYPYNFFRTFHRIINVSSIVTSIVTDIFHYSLFISDI